MFYLPENHFGGLLESDAASKMVDKKIEALLARPEGAYAYAPYICVVVSMHIQ